LCNKSDEDILIPFDVQLTLEISIYDDLKNLDTIVKVDYLASRDKIEEDHNDILKFLQSYLLRQDTQLSQSKISLSNHPQYQFHQKVEHEKE
jgi:hypothetical protein